MLGARHFATSVRDNTLVAFWVGHPTTERIESMAGQLSSLWEELRDGVYLINVISEHTGMPDNATRKAIARQFDSMRNRLKAAAIVLEKSGDPPTNP